MYTYVKEIFDFIFFFFNDTATTEIYTLSLHDALPICAGDAAAEPLRPGQFQTGRVERAGHAGGGRTRLPRPRAHRVSRLGPAPDEHALRSTLPVRRRRRLRTELRRGAR